MSPRLKKILTSVLKFGVAGGILYYLYQKGYLDTSHFKAILKLEFFVGCISLMIFSILIANYRWFLFLRSRQFTISFIESLKLNLIGLFFNYAMPGGVGGDIVKAFYIAKDNPGRKAEAATSVFVDRLIGLYAMVCLAMIASYANFDLVNGNQGLFSIFFFIKLTFFGLTVIALLSLSGRLKEFLVKVANKKALPKPIVLFLKFYDSVQSYRQNPKVLLAGFFLSLAAQTCAVLFIALVGYAMGVTQVGLAGYFFVIPIGFIVMSFPLAPAGIGVGQVALLYLFQLYTGEKLDVGPTAMTVWQVTLFFISLAGGYFYLVRGRNASIENS